jgi:hypothetical protein
VPTTLPVLTSGSVFSLTSSFGQEYVTTVAQFENDSEQRWSEKAPLGRVTAIYRNVSSYDLSTMLKFWNSYKGSFVDQALTSFFEVSFSDTSGNTYLWNYCIFENNDFTYTETQPDRFSFELNIRQVRSN